MSHEVPVAQVIPADVTAIPDPEVTPKAQRRRFSAEYKLRILREAEACNEAGELGALLRREGLYSSHLTEWRRQRAAGELAGLQPRKRGRVSDPLAVELAQAQQENERLHARLAQAELVIEVQKKLSQLLGLSVCAGMNGAGS